MDNELEFVLMFLQILVGFGSVCAFLFKISRKLDTKIDREECRNNRRNCPLLREMKRMKQW